MAQKKKKNPYITDAFDNLIIELIKANDSSPLEKTCLVYSPGSGFSRVHKQVEYR